ncbi:MAG: energy-coupling factor transporter transmembrane component T [Desulfobacterales bacterium]
MAELTAFSFRPGASLLHELDVRFKLVFLVLISLASLKAALLALCVLTFVLIGVIIDIRLPIKVILKELRYFLILLLFVFIARALTTPGSPLIQFKAVSVTREGVHGGIIVCWRLLIIIMMGLSFVSTTRPSEIKAAVQWFLNPFPFIPAKRIATMMSLIIRFMPVILDQAKETADAQRARGVGNRKNPVYRLKKLVIPLMRRTFENADKLAVAMEARCYSENRTDPGLSSGIRDWIALFAVICLCIIIIST